MKLIVGLGNPGIEYRNTRHNLGFMVINKYVSNHNLGKFQEKFHGQYIKTVINGENVLFVKPLSYMNLSGTVVRKYCDYFKIKIDDILIMHDDMDLDCGKIKLKKGGSSGGHNGIKNIIEELKTTDFKRFKIGIGKDKNMDVVDYVLGKLRDDELEKINKVLSISDDIIDGFITSDFDKLMCKYNGEKNGFK